MSCWQHLGYSRPPICSRSYTRKFRKKLASLTLFDDVLPTLDVLAKQEIQLAICSNLAKPYGVVIDKLLPQFKFARHLSYEIGAIKPDREIYESIVTGSGLAPRQILFIGDTSLADYEGPTQFGFRAKHLVRSQPSDSNSIGSLTDVLQLLTHHVTQ